MAAFNRSLRPRVLEVIEALAQAGRRQVALGALQPVNGGVDLGQVWCCVCPGVVELVVRGREVSLRCGQYARGHSPPQEGRVVSGPASGPDVALRSLDSMLGIPKRAKVRLSPFLGLGDGPTSRCD
jgi:hypothetical protein